MYAGDNPAIHRLFSLARSFVAITLLAERIPAAGIIAEENAEIEQEFPDYKMADLLRISFWESAFDVSGASCDDDCIGYAILKHDTVPSIEYDRWHVFEAVFKKYAHPHNCVPRPMEYRVTLSGGSITLKGLLYAQQNELNKSCSQVALRSLLSRITGYDVSYSRINQIARQATNIAFVPSKGLNVRQIRAVFKEFGVGFRDYEYTQGTEEERRVFPYQKFVYSGIESGTGALVGFSLSGPLINQRHIVPFYGHTFNKDTWAPDADMAYFRVGEGLGYVPSENWTSSFLGHDDNFGPNFCVPRLYIPPEQVQYVVELLKPRIAFGGAQAEALSLPFLYSVLDQADVKGNVWLQRLASQSSNQRIILRAISVDRHEYINHLTNERDWDQNAEHKQVTKALSTLLPESFWVVELSIPQLFPANKRKLGDIILNGQMKLRANQKNRAHFLLVRLPGVYFFNMSGGRQGERFLSVRSNLKSHFPVILLD